MRAPATSIARIAASADVARILSDVRAVNLHVLREGVVGGPVLSTSAEIDNYLRASMASAAIEELRVLFLDRGRHILAEETIATGAASFVHISPTGLFRMAIAIGASGMLLAHNHPSGNLDPSEDDIRSTRRLVHIGRLLGIDIVDHLIVTAAATLSMARLGLMER